MQTEEIKIHKGEWLTDALKRQGYENIPSNVILDKTLTGLGATHTELHSNRNSIIIEPNVPVILEKTKDNPDWLAVWENCTPSKVEKYLQSTNKRKKLICTPESFSKIREVANELNLNIYTDYFCLMDECEKFIQDVDYRKRITQPIYEFFQFQQKALVSATPLEISHPALVEQNFRKLKIVPQYNYQIPLELVVTNSYDSTVRKRFQALKDSDCICIFLNSTDGINKIIDSLHLTDYKVFCSNQSVKKLKEREFDNVYEMLEPLAKYNFFTCRFFSALDIKLKQKPDILILTNLYEAVYTMIDPFTEAIQIQGRFRNGFNSLTHISNVKIDLDVKSDEAIKGMIEEFEITYYQLKDRLEQATDKYRLQAIFKDMKAVKYADLLDKQGNINYFSVDNLYNEERVKGYYKTKESLFNAYNATNHFNVMDASVIEPLGEDDLLTLRKFKTDIEKRRLLTEQLSKLYSNQDQIDISFYLDILRKEDQGTYTIDAFQKIGKEGLEKAEYKKSTIDKAVKEYDKMIHRFLPEIIKDIQSEFYLNIWIEKEEIRDHLEMIYKKHNILYSVKLNTIEDYFWTKDTHTKKPYKYLLKKPKQDLGDF
ncbi:MAG: hypothetical protein J6K31_05510 [Parabacteroides sp.]|nr:hypothetical protein [Parabacteroides sp.]